MGVGRGAYAVSYTTLLHMKRLSQTESMILVIFVCFCFQRQSFLTFIISSPEPKAQDELL